MTNMMMKMTKYSRMRTRTLVGDRSCEEFYVVYVNLDSERETERERERERWVSREGNTGRGWRVTV